MIWRGATWRTRVSCSEREVVAAFQSINITVADNKIAQ